MEARCGSDFEPEEKIEDVRAFLHNLKCRELNLDPYGFSADKAFEYYRKLFTPMPPDQQERLFKSGSVEDGSVMREYRKPAEPAVTGAATDSETGETDAGGDVIPY
jgi:hypothetical protein